VANLAFCVNELIESGVLDGDIQNVQQWSKQKSSRPLKHFGQTPKIQYSG